MKRNNGNSEIGGRETRPKGARRSSVRCTGAAIPAFLGLLALATAAHSNPLGSNINNILINDCQNIDGLNVSLHVTQDMVETASQPGGGFAMQLNASPPAGNPVFWLQYGIIIQNDQARGFIQYWDNAGVNNNGEPVFLSLPSGTIAAGSVLKIALTNDSHGNVTGTTFSVTDNAGKTSTLQMPMPTYPNTTTPVLVPIEAFQVDIVGPINWENSTFSSGAGYLTYSIANGQLSVQGVSCTNADEAYWTGETSNSLYGGINPAAGSTVTQPVGTPLSGALTSLMDQSGRALQVYHLGRNSATGNLDLYQYAFHNGNWQVLDVTTAKGIPGAVLGSPVLSYENTIYNAPEAFYLAVNSAGSVQVEQLWGENWAPNSLTSLANAQPAALGSGLVGYIDSIAGTDNVFYQGTDRHVHLLTWSPGKPWKQDTTLVNTPAAAFASAMTGHMSAESEEVFYLGANQHVYELWRWSKKFDGWHSVDVTLANGSKPLAAIGSPLAGFYDAKAGTDAVFYVGTDQHVHELLFSDSDSRWEGIDATSRSEAPSVGTGSALAAHLNTTVASQEVFFVDANQNVQELWSWSTAAPEWHSSDVSMAAGDPTQATAGSPLTADINATVSPATDELYYVGVDGLVHEMWWNGSWHPGTP